MAHVRGCLYDSAIASFTFRDNIQISLHKHATHKLLGIDLSGTSSSWLRTANTNQKVTHGVLHALSASSTDRSVKLVDKEAQLCSKALCEREHLKEGRKTKAQVIQ